LVKLFYRIVSYRDVLSTSHGLHAHARITHDNRANKLSPTTEGIFDFDGVGVLVCTITWHV